MQKKTDIHFTNHPLSCPDDVLHILKTLQEDGHQAVLAGGCVRDWIMGKTAHDWDIATSAKPEQVEKLFPRTLPLGKAFGIIVILLHHQQYEVATFRGDGDYRDGRHPSSIFYASMEEDVKRRDFTVNAMLYDPIVHKLYDFVNGQQDLKSHILRTVGIPARRFAEDKLRILRGIRFAANLNFTLESETWQALKQEALKIHCVSIERITVELEKILLGGNSYHGFKLLRDAGLLKEILPEVHALINVKQPPQFHPEGDVWNHTMLMMKEWDRILPLLQEPTEDPHMRFKDTILNEATAEEKRTLAWATLLHDIGKPSTFMITDRIRFNGHDIIGARMAEKILKRLKMPTILIENICFLIHQHMSLVMFPQMRIAKRRRKLQEPLFPLLLELARLDCVCSHHMVELHHDICKMWLKEITLPKQPKPLISGKDLIAEGYKPGPLFCKILQEVHDAYLEDIIHTKEEALYWVQKKYNNSPSTT
ncbi:MAG: CCA tRNA nucleotidyltransferase [Lentisphaeria bacterium]